TPGAGPRRARLIHTRDFRTTGSLVSQGSRDRGLQARRYVQRAKLVELEYCRGSPAEPIRFIFAAYLNSMNVEPEVIIIPAGEFLMGCESGAANERPVHRVFVDEFAIGRFAVTNQLYQFFIEDTGHEAPPGWGDSRFNHPGQPVTNVSWFDAAAYCDWLSQKTGKLYRLPTEAEWERAARGGLEAKLYTWGDDTPQRQPYY